MNAILWHGTRKLIAFDSAQNFQQAHLLEDDFIVAYIVIYRKLPEDAHQLPFKTAISAVIIKWDQIAFFKEQSQLKSKKATQSQTDCFQ